MQPNRRAVAVLAALLFAALLAVPARAADNVFPSFSNGPTLPPGAVTKFDFSVTSTDTVYFLYSSPNTGDAFIVTPGEYAKFQAGIQFSSPGGFRNQSGRLTITLSPGNYSVAVRNTGGSPLDYAFRIVSAQNVLSVRANGTEQVLPGGRFTQAFVVNPADTIILTSVAEGLQGYILTPSEAAKFRAGVTFTPVGGQQILSDLASGSAHGELTLNQGTYHFAYFNPTSVQRPGTFVIALKKPDFTGGGPVAPPSDVVPHFDSTTDEGVGGTFLDGVFRTRFNNSSARLAPSFLVSGTTAGQFVRIYAAGRLIAEGVAGGPQLTLRAGGRAKLDDGTYPITASQFNGQTESDKRPFFSLVVDTAAPAPPSTPDLAATSDTGPSPDDNITGASQLTFTGTSEPLARVLMTAGGKLVNASSVQADESGNWSITFASPRPGKVRFGAIQMDTAGNVSKASSPLEVNLLKPPAAPGRLDLIKADKGKTTAGVINTTNPAPTFIGTGGKDNTVTLIIDGTDVQSAVVGLDGKWSITLSQSLTLGEHSVKARQADLAGGVSAESKSIRVKLNPAG